MVEKAEGGWKKTPNYTLKEADDELSGLGKRSSEKRNELKAIWGSSVLVKLMYRNGEGRRR